MNILIIEDEYSLADAIAETLKKENFNVNIKTNGEDGEDEALTGEYDLILLDVMLPKKNGFEILENVRKEKIKTPIIMLTADDYITKPFSTRELMARVKIILKRTNNLEDIGILEFGDLTLDIKNAKLKCNENEIQINGKELDLLEQLIINKNQVSIRENLAQKIWWYESEAEYNNVEVYVTFLRRKLNLLQSKVKIKAVRGIGYKMEE